MFFPLRPIRYDRQPNLNLTQMSHTCEQKVDQSSGSRLTAAMVDSLPSPLTSHNGRPTRLKMVESDSISPSARRPGLLLASLVRHHTPMSGSDLTRPDLFDNFAASSWIDGQVNAQPAHGNLWLATCGLRRDGGLSSGDFLTASATAYICRPWWRAVNYSDYLFVLCRCIMIHIMVCSNPGIVNPQDWTTLFGMLMTTLIE